MGVRARTLVMIMATLAAPAVPVRGEEPKPLHERIDALIEAGHAPSELSPPVDDPGFARRITLDLTGRIPTVDALRAFLDDPALDKRSALIDRLIDSDQYPRRMADVLNVMLMERLGDHPGWDAFLVRSLAENVPWDRLAAEMLGARSGSPAPKGAAFFLARRLDHYGENPVDYPGLTRDVGRLFLGIDLRCAQCHDHLFIPDYKQADFQGLHAFFQNVSLVDAKALTIAEKPTTEKLDYSSVFRKIPRQTAPRVPGQDELVIPRFAKGEEFVTRPDPKGKAPGVLKFSPLAELATRLPTAENRAFVRNAVNRLWFVMMGRGLIHPLDLDHAENPPSHAALLDLLADEFVASKFDIKALLHTLALTRAYQRSSTLVEGRPEPPPESFLTALEKRLSAEQLSASMVVAIGEESVPAKQRDALKAKCIKAFANAPREPEDEFSPSVRGALFVANDPVVLTLLEPREGGLVSRLTALRDTDTLAEELYLAILSRRPEADERAEVSAYLSSRSDRRAEAVGQLAWALLASTEFCVNH